MQHQVHLSALKLGETTQDISCATNRHRRRKQRTAMQFQCVCFDSDSTAGVHLSVGTVVPWGRRPPTGRLQPDPSNKLVEEVKANYIYFVFFMGP